MPAVKRRLNFVFLVLFAWLQCLAPLLHAHAAADGAVGVHLPERVVAESHGHDGLWQVDEPHGHATIAVASSIEPRQDGPWLDAPALPLGRLPAIDPMSVQSDPDPSCVDCALSRFSYLIAEACAPPRG